MVRVRSIAAALMLALGTVSTPMAAQKEEQANKITTKEVGKALKSAQEAMNNKEWDTALVEIEKAQAVENKTPYEAYQIDEFLSFVFIQQKKYGEAAAVYERMLDSGQMSPEQADERTKVIAQIYFQEKDYPKAAEWAKKWLDKHPNQPDMTVLLAQAYYLTNDYQNAASTISTVVANAEGAGQTPKENDLQILLSSYFKLDNRDGLGEALKKIVRYYPKTEYWANLLEMSHRKEDSDRVTLGYYRLMDDVGVLKAKGDYVEMAQLAIEAGVPGEAQHVVEKGLENGTLKSTDKTEQGRYNRLLNGAKKSAATDQATLPQLAIEAEKMPQGQAKVGLGQAYLSYGMYDEAIAALQEGIKKGSVKDADEAHISLGIAYLRKGQKDQARQAFKAVKNESEWSDLAELWEIRTYAES